MVRGESMARLFASPALTSRVIEYLELENAFVCGVVSHTFYDAISLISCAVMFPVSHIHRNPHVFARLKGLQTVFVQCMNEDEFSRIIAVTCSTVRKWKVLHIYTRIYGLEDTLVGHLNSLAGAIRHCLPELEDLKIDGVDSLMAANSPRGAEMRTAALRVLSAMPNNLALRCGLSWGLPIDHIREFAAGANVDVNLQSEYMDPVSISFAVRGQTFTDDCRSFMRDLVAAGMKLDVLDTQSTPLGISIERRHYSTALEFLKLGCDPNLGLPSPLEFLCESPTDSLVTHQDVKVLEAMLGAGANPFASFNGKTAMDSLISKLKEFERVEALHHVNRIRSKMRLVLNSQNDPASEIVVDDELINNAALPDALQNQLKAGKAALLEMQSLLVRAMHDSHQRRRRATAKARTKKQ